MSEPEELYNSSNVDYTPYIAPPSSTHPDAEYYTAHIEPALLAALEPLDIDFFLSSHSPFSTSLHSTKA